jgi:hypothetical protein
MERSAIDGINDTHVASGNIGADVDVSAGVLRAWRADVSATADACSV